MFQRRVSLEVYYNYNTKSWITSVIFEKWVMNFDKQIIRQIRKCENFLEESTSSRIRNYFTNQQ